MTTASQKNQAQSNDKAKRKTLTTAERIAKAEADLKALREKAHEKDAKQVKDLTEKRDALAKKVAGLQSQIEDFNSQIADAQSRIAGPITDGVGEANDIAG